jgi:hypothetical protein
MNFRPFATLLIALAAFTPWWTGCGSPEKKPEKPPPPAYVPPPPPPLEDLVVEAQDDEKAGTVTRSFTAVYGLDEAVRSYQRIINHYPHSDEAKVAKKKIRELGEKTREIRAWKRRIDSAKSDADRVSRTPSRMHKAYTRIVELENQAPEGFIRNAVTQLKDDVTAVYQKGALVEVIEAVKKAENARKRGDFREGLSAYQALAPGYVTDLPRVAAEIERNRTALESAVKDKAQVELNRARLARQRRQDRQCVLILRQAWGEYRGFEVAETILLEERKATLRNLKVLTAEASGKTRRIDKELFALMEAGFALNPLSADDREKIEKQLDGYARYLNKYRAALEEMACTNREFEIRRVFLDKMVKWERKRMQYR